MGFGRRGLTTRSGGLPLLATAVATAVLAGSAMPASAAPAPAQRSNQLAPAGVQVVTLVTGDRVAVQTDAQGRQRVMTTAAAGGHGAYTTVRQNGDLYVFPKAALPYLGVSLDRSLFDVSALIRDGSGSRVPVRVSFAAGAPQTAPGLTVTGSPNATTKDGYVAATDAAAFGAALTAQARHDIRAGAPANRQLFGGVTAIRYAGRGPGPVIQPNFPMFTLRINVLGLNGEPADFAFLDVINTDDGRKFLGFPVAVNGEARISVPVGHYSALLEADDVDADGNFVPHVVINDFEVTAASTITMDARGATAKVDFSVPRPAVADSYGFEWLRGTESASLQAGTFSVVPPFVSPTAAPQFGIQHYVSEAMFSSPAGTTPTYGFDLRGTPTEAIAANQHTDVTARSLATVHETFANDKQQEGGIARFAFESWQFFALGVSPAMPQPTRNTEYVTARPDLTHSAFTVANNGFDSFGSFLSNGPRTYAPRQQVNEEWFRGPIKPGFPADPATSNFAFCNICRADDNLEVFINPETDSTPDHFGFLDAPSEGVTSTAHFQLLSGSTVIADGQDMVGGIFPVPAAATNYKIVYDQTRIAPWFVTAPVSHTEWTFRSATSPARTVPDKVLCFSGDNCSGVSVLDTTYHLNGSLLNTMKPGVASMELTIRHAPYTRELPITRTRVSLSFDGGRTFRPAAVVPLGHGRFHVVWVNPRHAGPVTLKVSAADTAGSTISQTIEGAYVISGGSRG